MKSTGMARWEGAAGKVSAASGLFKDAVYTAKARFEGAEAYTTPEELIAAAHAACFSMAFNVALSRNNINAQSIDTKGRGGDSPRARRRLCHHAQHAELHGKCARRGRGQAARTRRGSQERLSVSKALKNNVEIALELNVKT
jgi:osmotically inducible protein OsmC